jgi:protein FRA10AC1
MENDEDVIMENIKFIWDEHEAPVTWEEKLAKKYYDKLLANRFRIEQEVVTGKRQFSCSEKSCKIQEGLRTWEVNFT